MLSPEEARSYYDRFGRKQDSQAFYEDPATEDLIEHSRFGGARAIFEFGIGTGRFAEKVLSAHAPTDCTYRAVDISPTMIEIANDRLRDYAERIRIELAHGETRLSLDENCCDRFVSNYVIDLLSEADAKSLIEEARRILQPGGLLCLVSLTHGKTLPTRVVSRIWESIYSINSRIVGGCRPIELNALVSNSRWTVEHCTTVASYGLTSEILVARRPD